MDLNHIDLSASLVAAIYKNHLTGSEQPSLSKQAPQVTTGAKKDIQYLGNNQKGICLLVDYANDVYLPDEQLNFLTSILQACKLNLGDVAIINCNQQKYHLKNYMHRSPVIIYSALVLRLLLLVWRSRIFSAAHK